MFRSKIKYFFYLLVFLFVLIILFCIYEDSKLLITRQIILNSENVTSIDEEQPKVILLWNGFFSNKRWNLPNDTNLVECSLAKCIFTNEHTYLKSFDKYNSIIFHIRNEFGNVPEVRNPLQLYIFALLESPVNTKINLKNKENFFNLTMTYRLDSDILWSYSTIIDKETNIATAPALIPYWRKVDSEWTQNNESLSIIINNKKKLIAWFVSNCRTYSKRERLVKELQKYIPVDIFGKCGDLKCKYGSTDCDEVLDTEYKFYLSFENSLCLDYVTEKFYNALKRNIVPVVFGGANYSKFAPPHSFIDAHGFQSAEELAKYLLNLNNTPNEYARYFWWRRFYTIKGNTIPFCDICHHLNKPVTQYRTQIYKSIDDYWHHNTCIDASS